ncbi:hypothetical protein K439DRAFT_1421442 [Ramaria rubella]|nr:hypothetical protein K439DRAFT_1421442 [Ramaria rubella]
MSKPPVIPETSTSGIAVDPRTLSRVVPESRRPDGSTRKEIKIRPGYIPQEDVTRFRGTRQVQMDRNALPKGHILGWVAPSSASKPKSVEATGAASKSAKKNEKRKEKRDKKKEEVIRANWEDDDVVKDADGAPNWAKTVEAQDNKLGDDEKEKGKRTGGKETGEANDQAEPPSQDPKALDDQLKHLKV